jgi:hypothetical protein
MNFPSLTVTKPGGTVESVVGMAVGVDGVGLHAKVKRMSPKMIFLLISRRLYRPHLPLAPTLGKLYNPSHSEVVREKRLIEKDALVE